jgi:hypothetical protein
MNQSQRARGTRPTRIPKGRLRNAQDTIGSNSGDEAEMRTLGISRRELGPSGRGHVRVSDVY